MVFPLLLFKDLTIFSLASLGFFSIRADAAAAAAESMLSFRISFPVSELMNFFPTFNPPFKNVFP